MNSPLFKRMAMAGASAAVALSSLFLVSCATPGQSAAAAGIGGALLGAAIGNQSGEAGEGALIGGALGTAAGYAVGMEEQKRRRAAYYRQQAPYQSQGYPYPNQYQGPPTYPSRYAPYQ